MTAIIGTGLNVGALRGEFFERLAAMPALWADLSTTIKATTKTEKFRFLGSVPPLRAWGHGRLARGLNVESYDVVTEKYESTLSVDRDEIDDDQLGQLRIRVNELASKAAAHKDLLLSDLIVNGGETGFNSYLGVPFFSTALPIRAGGTQSNDVSYDATTAAAPTTAEFRAAFSKALAALLGLKDDQGEPLNISATGLVAVVPPTMLVTAMEALNTTIVAQTSNVLQGAARVMSFSRLTAPEKWYLFKTDGGIRPFVFLDRQPIEFTALEQGTEEAFLRERYLYGVRGRYTMTYGRPEHGIRVTFT